MKIAHIDLGNQIENSWNKPSVLALKYNSYSYSIKIKSQSKKIIRNHINWKSLSRKKRRKSVTMIYSFLLYKLLSNIPQHINKVLCCRDINPPKDISNFLRLVSKNQNFHFIGEKIKIKFKNNSKNSRAHRTAHSVFKGRKKYDYLISKEDVESIKLLIKENVL